MDIILPILLERRATKWVKDSKGLKRGLCCACYDCPFALKLGEMRATLLIIGVTQERRGKTRRKKKWET